MVIQPPTSGSKYGNTPGKTGPLQLGTYSKKVSVSLLFSQKFNLKLHTLRATLAPSSPDTCIHTYAGIVGDHYINIFTHHITGQHMALCNSIIGGTGTHSQNFLDTVIYFSSKRAPLLAHSPGIQSKGLYPCGNRP